MIIVDSSVWIDYFNGRPTKQTETLDSILGVHEVGIGDLILLEVLQGFRSDTHHTQAKEALTSLPTLEMLGTARAVLCAELFRSLRKNGVTIRKTADVIVAGFCIDHGYALLYSDRDFDPFVEHCGLRSLS